MPLQIERASPRDIPDIIRLNGVVQDHHVGLDPELFRADWEAAALAGNWSVRLADPNGTVAIARVDGRAVGYIWFVVQDRPRDALHHPHRRIYVHHISVDADVRRAGTGAALLDEAEREARRLGIATVALDAWAANERAQGFFERCGYEPRTVGRVKAIGSD